MFKKAPKKIPFKFSNKVLGTGAALLFGASSYAFYRYSSAHAIPRAEDGDPSASAEYRAYDVIAKKYDDAVGMEEWSLWYWMMRTQLLKEAYGDVLEVSSGTGRNLKYYPLDNIKTLTLTDISQPMLSVCEDKYFDELKLGYSYPDTKVYFSLADGHCLCGNDQIPEPEPEPEPEEEAPVAINHELEGSGSLLNFFRVLLQTDGKIKMPDDEPEPEPEPEPVPEPEPEPHAEGCGCDGLGRSKKHLQRCSTGVTEAGHPLVRFKPRSFDTVVDTFGLCSHEDPVKVLTQMAAVLRPGGRLLLLQHGRSYYEWLNNFLNGRAEDHHEKWGCWWNRDIERIVKSAGLKVVKSTRWHFGTSYFLVCEPDTVLVEEIEKELRERGVQAAGMGAVDSGTNEGEEKKKKRFLFF